MSDDHPTAPEVDLEGAAADGDYRARVRHVLSGRLNRLLRLLALDAPDSLLAAELALVGKVAVMVDPVGMARMDGERNERRTRRRIGLCVSSGCTAEPVGGDIADAGDHCAEHAAQLLDVATKVLHDLDVGQVPS